MFKKGFLILMLLWMPSSAHAALFDAPKILLPKAQYKIATYRFSAKEEPMEINRITIVNDSEGDGFEADPKEATPLISRVTVGFLNADNVYIKRNAFFVANRAIITDMTFFVPKDRRVALDLFVDVQSAVELKETDYGTTFRLGIQEYEHKGLYFQAKGLVSNHFTNNIQSFSRTSQSKVPVFVVRKALPVFDFKKQVWPNRLDFTIQAQGGSIGLARMVFEAGRKAEVKLIRDSVVLKPSSATTVGDYFATWDGTKLILVFTKEDVISPGTLRQYQLSLPDAPKRTIRLLKDLQFIPKGNLFETPEDFMTRALPNRNLIWSDHSASQIPRPYPSFQPDFVPTFSGGMTADFTNGYLVR